jgi:hypothetical protein
MQGKRESKQSSQPPMVGIIMGSDSDLPVMQAKGAESFDCRCWWGCSLGRGFSG